MLTRSRAESSSENKVTVGGEEHQEERYQRTEKKSEPLTMCSNLGFRLSKKLMQSEVNRTYEFSRKLVITEAILQNRNIKIDHEVQIYAQHSLLN